MMAITALAAQAAGAAKPGKLYNPDMTNCAGFTAADAAGILGVPASGVKAWTQRPHPFFWTCTFIGGKLKLELSVAVSSSVEDAVTDMERYRGNMERVAGTDAFKDGLPDGGLERGRQAGGRVGVDRHQPYAAGAPGQRDRPGAGAGGQAHAGQGGRGVPEEVIGQEARSRFLTPSSRHPFFNSLPTEKAAAIFLPIP